MARKDVSKKRGMSGKLADIDMLARHVANMSPTFPTKSVMGWLPPTFGCEQVGYSCGTLFVDHASGKVFNFCQYSTTGAKPSPINANLNPLLGRRG